MSYYNNINYTSKLGFNQVNEADITEISDITEILCKLKNTASGNNNIAIQLINTSIPYTLPYFVHITNSIILGKISQMLEDIILGLQFQRVATSLNCLMSVQLVYCRVYRY